MTRTLFIHHSVGRHLVADGELRRLLREDPRTASVELWDIDYRKFGTIGPDGEPTDIGIEIPDDNTDPAGLHRLLLDPALDQVRQRITAFDLVAHKSCYPASQISSATDLEARKVLYSEVISACAKFPTTFLLFTPPPLTPLRTSRAAATNAVAFADWLAETNRPNNVAVFDLHRVLREPSGGRAGTLAAKYRARAPWDSHPNANGRIASARALADAIGNLDLRSQPGQGGAT